MNITLHYSQYSDVRTRITEYESNGWKIFVLYSWDIPVGGARFNVEGLTHGDISKSALLITYYYDWEMIDIAEMMPVSGLTVYMSEWTKDASLDYIRGVDISSEERSNMIKFVDAAKTYSPGKRFTFGAFDILPVKFYNHLYDVNALIIEVEGFKIMHTGPLGTDNNNPSEEIVKSVGCVDYLLLELTENRSHSGPGPKYIECDEIVSGVNNQANVDADKKNESDIQNIFGKLNLISLLCPKAIIPISVYSTKLFADYVGDKLPMIILNDGEAFSPTKKLWN